MSAVLTQHRCAWCRCPLDGKRKYCDRVCMAAGCRKRDKAPCAHCGRKLQIKHRGLCSGCYYTPEVRAQYPSSGTYSGQEERLRYTGALPDEPTDVCPGTPQKVAVMAQRVAAGRSPWHPEDAGMKGDA